jgi:hypothetical protein
MAVQSYLLIDDARITPEAPLPVSVAHQNDRGGPLLCVASAEVPADDWLNAKDPEKLG